MKIYTSSMIPAVSCAFLLVACGGGGDDSNNTTVVEDPNPEVPFFNDDAKIGYVDAMLGRFLSVLKPATNLQGNILAKRTIAATETESITCSGGGSIDMSLTGDEGAEAPESVGISFNNCIEDGETSNGSIVLNMNLDSTGDNGTISLSATNLTITGGDEDIAINGAVSISMQSTDSSSTFTISGSDFSMSAGGESIAITNYNLTAIEDLAAGTNSLSAAMTVSSNVDGTVTFAVNPPLFGNESDDYPTSGTITMTHSDGSSLSMNADNGDPETFDYIIFDGSATSTGVQRWDDTELSELDL